MKIRTKNLTISTFQKSDINEEYISWMNDLDIIRYLGREDYFNGFSKTDGIEYYENMFKDNRINFLSIYYKSGEFIGTCKVILIEKTPNNKISEIGIMIGNKRFWGMGLAKETIIALSKFLFNDSNNKIVAGGFLCNKSMVNAFKASGFKEEGILRKRIFSRKKYYDQIIMGCFKNELIV